ncbi:RDD family protein [Streptomyces sp. NPDC014805]|uniref:RDD family protein n=1 Tax=Streptomyces sp. NPDC014805 TaxID=3364919 RepID=UPI0036FB8E21
MSELVTGEAVALELRHARLPSRALAVVIDLIVAIAAYTVVTVALLVATASLDDAARTAVSIAAFLLVLVGAPIAVETLSHGRSLGKLACGLRVVRDDGGPIRFRHALVRGAVGVVEILLTFGVVACIASLVSERGRRLGDVFAGTLVVRERVPQTRTGFLPPPPPWLAGRFGQLDLSAVPDALWLAVRQYLSRMHQLDPQVGSDMAQRLAADLSARTGTPVPPGIPPAAYLAAVLQERQAREARRAFAHGPQAAGAQATGAQSTGPQGVGPLTTGPQTAGPQTAEPQAAGPFSAPLGPSGTPAPDPHTTSSPAPSAPPAAAPTPPPTESSESRPHTGFAPPA